MINDEWIGFLQQFSQRLIVTMGSVKGVASVLKVIIFLFHSAYYLLILEFQSLGQNPKGWVKI